MRSESRPFSTTHPRAFFKPPVAIPSPRAKGEIVIEAKVNTGGEVVAVRIVKNTTGKAILAEANAAALQQSRFYPIIQKGQRMTFNYNYAIAF